MEHGSILVPGRNCWRVEAVRQAEVLVDGAAYFAALRSALEQARDSIFILGWDIDSRVRLSHDSAGTESGGSLGALLDWLVRRHRRLHTRILVWDFAMIYTLEREWLSAYQLGWKTHRRLEFRRDACHPAGASHHQKVVVIDDCLAFVGGFDLTRWRWDTREHRPGDPRRIDTEGRAYPPFHDLEWVVDGDAAAALGALARERWRRATGQRVRGPAPAQFARWPENIEPRFRDVKIGIARTEPELDGNDAVREVGALYVDSIEAARRFIYVENQFLTSKLVTDRLVQSLERQVGPEVILILPKESGGWLERKTMDVLRARALGRLRAADKHGRLRVYFPAVGDQAVNVHAKVMVADEQLLRIGSSNLSNRSMGLDTECDLAIEALRGEDCEAIANVRNGLLAEHLGVEQAAVAAALREHGSPASAIDALRGGPRTLHDLQGLVPEYIDRQVPDSAVIDPEQPLNAERLSTRYLRPEQRASARHRGARYAAIVIALLLVAAAWRWTPLREYAQIDDVQRWLHRIQGHPLAPAVVMVAYLAAGLVAFPITLMVGATVVIFGPWVGFLYALVGSLLSAVATYALGQYLGAGPLERFAGPRIARLSGWLVHQGLLTVLALRIVPVAPFTVVNVVAGASRIRFLDFFLGTLLGMLPGLVGIALFVDRLIAALRDPGWIAYATVVALGVMIAAALVLLRRWLGDRGS
ncbi:MAG: hypothetical protein GWO16_12320 [Gammaproteobacteria bacterium]|nr:hypothetical protein [Gammaproteobacteria bacterium]NIR31205.1 hypothetical protein [Gammaproteobacteria bacterium]NIR98694.1 hypothetical protein [Gammaproteobacteria bacterium]NIT64409.1 hypothetical protein [Gammaproteobacteria bacterium]NIV21334.1 hypothetical protein [Gammaproteobacteria bacterium]